MAYSAKRSEVTHFELFVVQFVVIVNPMVRVGGICHAAEHAHRIAL